MLVRHLVATVCGVLLGVVAFSAVTIVRQPEVAAAGQVVESPRLSSGTAHASLAALPDRLLTARIPNFQAIAPPPPPPPPHNWLRTDDGAIDTYVGYYSDCTGRQALTHAYAAIDTCLGGRTYFIGHNPGLFTPLMAMNSGSELTYFDGAGTAHRIRVIGVRDWYRFAGSPPLVRGDVAYQFQTCLTLDGTWDRILDAIEVSG